MTTFDFTAGEIVPFEFQGPSGLVAAGDLTFRIENAADAIVLAETSAGMAEFATGNYRISAAAPEGFFSTIWKRPSTGQEWSERFRAGGTVPTSPVDGPEASHYVSLDAIRLELGVDDVALPDDAAAK